MGTIDDIIFDNNYSHAIFRFLLLNDQILNQIGPSPVIVLRHAPLMVFIHVFHDLIQCQQYINNENRKMISLVISEKQIIDWNEEIKAINHNIDKIYIFCSAFSNYSAMKKWHGCYRNKIQDVYLPDTFEYNLLRLGVDYIHKIMPEFRQDRGVYRKFATDAQHLLGALNNYFQDQIDSLNDDSVVAAVQ
jgi:hypothetical protein